MSTHILNEIGLDWPTGDYSICALDEVNLIWHNEEFQIFNHISSCDSFDNQQVQS